MYRDSPHFTASGLIHQSLFHLSRIDGHLYYFYFCAIANGAAINNFVLFAFPPHSIGRFLEVGLLSQKVNLYASLLDIAHFPSIGK